jgi:hypothetical protein
MQRTTTDRRDSLVAMTRFRGLLVAVVAGALLVAFRRRRKRDKPVD